MLWYCRFLIDTVHPPLPLNVAVITVPDIAAYMLVSGAAGISIPLWYEDAKAVGDVLFPKYELILVVPGSGQKKLLFDLILDWVNELLFRLSILLELFEVFE